MPTPLSFSPAAPFERLSLWENATRLLVAWVLGLVLFVLYLLPLAFEEPATQVTPAGLLLLFLDVLVGHLVLVVAAFRRRAPVTIAVVTMALTIVSIFAVPAAYLAALSLATRRRLGPVLWLGALNLVSALSFENLISRRAVPAQVEGITGQGWLLDNAIYAAFITLGYVVAVLIGWNIGSRRELVSSWREQAEVANREQSARVAQAQLAERARIAREMHDVLAHRLSLVAMHAGVLAHRTDLSDQERAEAAEIVRAGAHQALEELREVLGVLRADGEPGAAEGLARVEAPQPGISGIPSLVAEATSGGQVVRLLVDEELWPRSVSLPASTGRHAYRLVQEALTNARRHAAGAPVSVAIDGAPGRGLSIIASNRLTGGERGTSGGRGLTGMAERAQLAGGHFVAGPEAGRFLTKVWLPWPEDAGGAAAAPSGGVADAAGAVAETPGVAR